MICMVWRTSLDRLWRGSSSLLLGRWMKWRVMWLGERYRISFRRNCCRECERVLFGYYLGTYMIFCIVHPNLIKSETYRITIWFILLLFSPLPLTAVECSLNNSRLCSSPDTLRAGSVPSPPPRRCFSAHHDNPPS